MKKYKQHREIKILRNYLRVLHDCCTKRHVLVSHLKSPNGKDTRTVQKNLQSHVWRISISEVIGRKMITATTDRNISIVHCFVSFGTEGGWATWKSTRTLETERCTEAKNRKRVARKRRARMNGWERQTNRLQGLYQTLYRSILGKPPYAASCIMMNIAGIFMTTRREAVSSGYGTIITWLLTGYGHSGKRSQIRSQIHHDRWFPGDRIWLGTAWVLY